MAAASAAKAAIEECIICCEPFNKSSHLPVECEHVACKYKVCMECVRAYLLTSINEPHCMNCKVNWSAKFMLILKKNWLSETYRPHREKLLCDVEMSKLAETMPDAERYKAGKRQDAVTEALTAQYDVLKRALDNMTQQMRESMRIAHAIRHNIGAKKEEKKEFFMPCPAINCNGMLSTQYKCGICEQFSCHDCHEVIGLNKTETLHTCDPNNVASALAIKKETKQCPGCHNRIYRVEGCSQMWCTGCHTAFDWNTGRKVQNERLHNPHWLEYQRGLNGGTAPRAPGDVPCGGLCARGELNTRIVVKVVKNPWKDSSMADALRSLHRMVDQISTNDVRELRQRMQTLTDFKDQRIKYIVGEMTREQLSSHIFRNDKLRQKNTELLNVYELLSAVGIDFFNRLLANEATGDVFVQAVIAQLEEYNKLRLYCNELFAVISNTYNMSVPQITKSWTRISEKFNSKSLKTAGASAAGAGAAALAIEAVAGPAPAPLLITPATTSFA